MRVLFSPSYQLELDPKQAANREPYPPLGTLYAASCLRNAGHEVALSDSMLALGMVEYRRDLERFRPELVAIYEDDFNYLSKMCLTNMRDAAREKARLAKEAGARVVVHGSDASDHLEEYLRAPVDFAVLGEGEETLSDLVRVLERDGPGARWDRVPGIAFLDDGSRVVKTAPRPFLRELDRLPLPAWDLVDVERYRSAWLERHDFFSVNMVTTRGCPYHCNWCAKPIYGQRYQMRSPAGVAEELSFLRRVVRPDHVWFADDIFGLKPGWVEAFASEVDARGARTPFKMQARADLIDENVADALARAGCANVWMGAESGSQKVLDAMEKGIRVEQIFLATKALRQRGIR
ncbi:MAG: B12-binding domain-containing radical SAM protein, partial [Vicinamibacteria bacterium]